MEAPFLPTDNLYKFLALGGLVAALGLMLYFEEQTRKMEVQVQELKNEMATAELEVGFLNEDLEGLEALGTNILWAQTNILLDLAARGASTNVLPWTVNRRGAIPLQSYFTNMAPLLSLGTLVAWSRGRSLGAEDVAFLIAQEQRHFDEVPGKRRELELKRVSAAE